MSSGLRKMLKCENAIAIPAELAGILFSAAPIEKAIPFDLLADLSDTNVHNAQIASHLSEQHNPLNRKTSLL